MLPKKYLCYFLNNICNSYNSTDKLFFKKERLILNGALAFSVLYAVESAI